MLAIGDALALTLMEKQFSKEQYGLRHHGGYLGRNHAKPSETSAIPTEKNLVFPSVRSFERIINE